MNCFTQIFWQCSDYSHMLKGTLIIPMIKIIINRVPRVYPHPDCYAAHYEFKICFWTRQVKKINMHLYLYTFVLIAAYRVDWVCFCEEAMMWIYMKSRINSLISPSETESASATLCPPSLIVTTINNNGKTKQDRFINL